MQSMRYSLGLLRIDSVQLTCLAGIKYFPPPKNYDRLIYYGGWMNLSLAVKIKFTMCSREDSISTAELNVFELFAAVGEMYATETLRAIGKTEQQLVQAVSTQPNKSPHSFFLLPTDEAEIGKIISNLKIASAPGSDNIDIEIPDRQRLRVYDKVPQYPSNLKPPKMQKRLRYMRGPELLHNTLQLKQFGVIALGGGRMRHEHFEMARLVVARHLNMKTMFAIWRIDPPWQPITKKGQGQRMGGGKGAIDHYVTPLKAGRVILEVGGKMEYENVQKMLRIIAERLPFKAMPVSQEIMEARVAEEKWKEENNKNDYTMKFIIQNNMGGCHKMLSPVDHFWFGKYR